MNNKITLLFIYSIIIFFAFAGSIWTVTTAFSINNKGTVLDKKTGLMWQDKDDMVERNWKEASLYCEKLAYGGYDDWRVPSINELMSIIDYSRYCPAIDSVFGNSSSWYWSNSINIIDNSRAWFVDFIGGNIDNCSKSNDNCIRCVRLKSYQLFDFWNRFFIKSKNVIEDTKTGLQWQRNDDKIEKKWKTAFQYCDNLTLDGDSDWRLPTIEELSSIIDYTKCKPAISNVLLNFFVSWYWSKSTRVNRTNYAWFVYFLDGSINSCSKLDVSYVRCVRGVIVVYPKEISQTFFK